MTMDTKTFDNANVNEVDFETAEPGDSSGTTSSYRDKSTDQALDDDHHRHDISAREPSQTAAIASWHSKRNMLVTFMILALMLAGVLFVVLYGRHDKSDGLYSNSNSNSNSNAIGNTSTPSIPFLPNIPTESHSNDSPTNTNDSQPFAGTQVQLPFDFKLSLFTPKIVKGYANASDFKRDLEQAAMAQVNGFILKRRQQLYQETGTYPSDGHGPPVSYSTPESSGSNHTAESSGSNPTVESSGSNPGSNHTAQSSGSNNTAQSNRSNHTAQSSGSNHNTQSSGSNYTAQSSGSNSTTLNDASNSTTAYIAASPIHFRKAARTLAASTNTSVPRPSSFGTNNQNLGIEEGDTIVSDGSRVYAAFDDKIIVWNAATGANVTGVTMDPIMMNYGNITQLGGGNGTTKSDPPIGTSGVIPPTPKIHCLAIRNGYLIAVVDGYGPSMATPNSIFYDAKATRALIYEIQRNGTLVEKARKDWDGTFISLRIIDDYAHVFTTTLLKTSELLGGALSSAEYANFTEEELVAEAQNVVIPSFVKAFADSLQGMGSDWSRIFQLSNMQPDSAGGFGNLAYALLYENGPQNMAMVSSFSLSSSAANEVLDSKSTMIFVPFSLSQLFAFSEYVVFFGYGQKTAPTNQEIVVATYFYAVRLSGATSQPHAVAMADGTVANNYAMSGSGNLLYAATSVMPTISYFADFNNMILISGSDAFATQQDQLQSENKVIVFEMPGRNGTMKGLMAKTGTLILDDPTKLMKTIRFYPDKGIGYVVTGETGAIYLVNLTVPTSPTTMASMDAPMNSDYLSPWDSSRQVMIGIGQSMDGLITRTNVAVFNFRNLTKPFWNRLVIETDNETSSWTDASYDFQAVRFVKQENLLIVPVHRNNWQTYFSSDGFDLFRVLESRVERLCNIAINATNCTNCGSRPRSMLFRGDLTMVYAKSVVSTAFSTNGSCLFRWEMDVS